MGRDSIKAIINFLVFLFAAAIFRAYTIGMKQVFDNALDNICQYIEEGYLTDKLNERVYAQNMEEYTIRLLNQVKYEAIESIIDEEYEISLQKLEITERYMEACTKIIYEYDLQDEKIVGAYRSAYRLYVIAKKHIEN